MALQLNRASDPGQRSGGVEIYNLRNHFYFQILPQHKKKCTGKNQVYIQPTPEQHRGEGCPLQAKIQV